MTTELKKAYEAIKAGNVEVGEEIAEVNAGEEIADITDAETAEVIPVERFWCEVEIAELSEQDAADIVAHFHGQDGANKFFKMRATELDGTEEDIDGDNVFDYLPTLDELNDVDIDNDDDNTPPADEPMSDDISDIATYPDIEDDDKPCRLDWDDSATFIDERTGEEELAEFNALPVIPAGTFEPVIIDNGKTYTKREYEAKTADAYNHTFTTKTDKNGRTLYYLGGKRVSRDDYFWEYDRRSEMIDEMLDKRMDWFDKPEEIDGVITLDSGVERDEVADVKGIGDLADRYIEIDGAAVQSVEVKQVGRRNSYYIDGKRASRDKAREVCAKMRGDNHFTIEYQRERKTISRFNVKISMTDDGFRADDGFRVISGQATIHTFEDIDDAVACVNQIEAAFIAGKAGVKVDSGGTVSDLDTFNRRTEEIGDDLIVWHGDEWHGTYSLKYDADFFKGIRSGKLHYRVGARVVSEQEFWQAMIERGACTIDLTDAEKLTAKLKEVTRKARLIEIYPQVGGRIVDPLYKVEIVPDGGGFIFTNGHETLARYDTKEQCLDVIERIKTAIDCGDLEFEFPTAELVDLEKKLPALMIEDFNKYRYRSKGRSIPRRFLAAQLKYYGLSITDLKEAHHAV